MKQSLWNELISMFTSSNNVIKLEDKNEDGEIINSYLGINSNSVLGHIILNSSGIIVNNYLRIFANGNGIEAPNIYNYNKELQKYFGLDKLFIANDIWGGLFAMNNGYFDGDLGDIWYFAPDTLEWENTEKKYPQFISWISSDNLNDFYKSFIWKDCENIISNIKFDQGVLIYPFLWANECDIEKANKKIISFKELILLNLDYKRKLNI